MMKMKMRSEKHFNTKNEENFVGNHSKDTKNNLHAKLSMQLRKSRKSSFIKRNF